MRPDPTLEELNFILASIKKNKDEGNSFFRKGLFAESDKFYQKGIEESVIFFQQNTHRYEEFTNSYKEIFEDLLNERKLVYSNLSNSLQKQKKTQ